MATSRLVATLLLVLLSQTIDSSSIVRVDSGVYERVTVKIDDSVPRQHCRRAIDNIQDLVTSVSRRLHSKALGGRRFFSSVLVQLPSGWAGTECVDGLALAPQLDSVFPQNPDFRVGPSSWIWGSSPRVGGQYGGCGVPARDGVHVPFEVITGSANVSDSDELGTFLSWCRYRYGVFPESGFPRDPIYPDMFSVGDEQRANQGCNSTTQMGLCPIKGYMREVPSKQNVLCDRRSALEVVLAHEDFANILEEDLKKNFTHRIRNKNSFEVADGFEWPKFTFAVRRQRRRFVLALDLTQSMRRWSQLRHAIFRFFLHVPSGSEVGVVTFGAFGARINLAPALVTDANRHGIFGKIPFKLLEDDVGCAGCGLRDAIKLASNDDSTIILMTASDDLKDKEVLELKDKVEEKALPIYSVTFDGLCKEVDVLTKFGGSFSVSLDRPDIVQSLADIFIAIINTGGNTRMIKKSYEHRYNLNGGQAIAGNFVVEENLDRDLWLILTSRFKEDVETFEVTSPSGIESKYPKYENGLVYFHKAGANEAGIWSYRAKLYPSTTPNSDLTVEVLAQSGDNDGIELKAWSNADGISGIDVKEEPVMIYASLYQEDLPIRGAEVKAKIRRPGSSTDSILVLRDDGTGYPDVTAGDGIYSAYFTDLTSEPGFYGLQVSATHNSGDASIPKPSSVQDSPAVDCCGSSMTANVYSVPTRSFELHVTAQSFKVTSGVEFVISDVGRPMIRDIFPPVRVTDLAVENYIENSLYATLTWLAPGGDYKQGKAAKYEIRCYTNMDALSDGTFSTMGIPVHESLLPKPAEAGTRQTATVALPWANEVFYYGLVSVDDAGNRGKVSNLIPVFALEVTTTTNLSFSYDGSDNSIDGVSDEALLSSLDAFTTNNTVLLVAGVVSGLTFIIVFIIIISVCRSRRKSAMLKQQKEARTQIFVNDIDAPDLGQSEQEVKPPAAYGGLWSSAAAEGSRGNHSPSSDFSYNLYNSNSRGNNLTNPSIITDQWTYLGQPAAVHDYRPPSATAVEVTPSEAMHIEATPAVPTPTYQNWTKPPSDNGTASTECSESDHSEKTLQAAAAAAAAAARVPLRRRFSSDHYSYSEQPNFSSEKRRRQESLV